MALDAPLAQGHVKVVIDFEQLRAQLDTVRQMLAERLPSVYTITLQANTTQFTQQVNQAASSLQGLVNQSAAVSRAMGGAPGGYIPMPVNQPHGAGPMTFSQHQALIGNPLAPVGPGGGGFGPQAYSQAVAGGYGHVPMPIGGPMTLSQAQAAAQGPVNAAWASWQLQQQMNFMPGGMWAEAPAQIAANQGMIAPGIFGTGTGAFRGGLARGAIMGINPWLGMAMQGGREGVGMAAGLAGFELGKWGIGQSLERGWNEATIARISGITGADRANVMEQVRGIGFRVPIDQGQVYGLGAGAARAGISSEQLPQFIEGMAKIAVIIDDMDPNELATDMARLLDLFDKAPADIEKVGGALAALDQSSTASASQILQLTQRLAGYASSMGITLPQTMAIATLAGQVGIKPERGATAIQRIMTQMTLDEKGRYSGLMGVSQEEWQARMQASPFEAFKGLTQKIAGMGTGTEQTKAIYGELGLHNTRDIELLQKFASELDKLPGLLDKAAGSVSALNDQVAIMAKEPEGQRREMINRLNQAGADLGDAILGAASNVLGAIQGAAQMYAKISFGGGMSPGDADAATANARKQDPRGGHFGEPFFMIDEFNMATGVNAGIHRMIRQQAIGMTMGVAGRHGVGPPVLGPEIALRQEVARQERAAAMFRFVSDPEVSVDRAIAGATAGAAGGMIGGGPLGAIGIGIQAAGLGAGPLGQNLRALRALQGRGAVPHMEGSISGLDEFMRRSSTEVLNSAKTIDDWQKKNAEEQTGVLKEIRDGVKALVDKPAGLRIGRG